jgi:hypothetical protein
VQEKTALRDWVARSAVLFCGDELQFIDFINLLHQFFRLTHFPRSRYPFSA